MHINIIAVGDRMPAWVDLASREYLKRMPPQYQIRLHEIPAAKRTKNSDQRRVLEIEAARIKSAIPDGNRIIVLDQGGRPVSTNDVVSAIRDWSQSGLDVAILIGGPDGLAEDCLAVADESWSLSKMTFPHHMVRVMLAEQLYRAWSIISNLPYHR